jgi:hypothetical protein
MNVIAMNIMNVVNSWRRGCLHTCLALALIAVTGCGGNEKAASTAASSTRAPAATTEQLVPATTTRTQSSGEEEAPSVVYDYAASADCLDQYSGAAGDNRGRNGAALIYTVRVPKEETERTDTGVRLLFYPSEAQARRHVHDPGFLAPAEKRVIGNVIVDGDAVRHAYAMSLVIDCLRF